MRDILKRLEAIERQVKPAPLIVLAELEGKEVTMTARECAEQGARFIKVLDGYNLKDLDILLESILGDVTEGSGSNDE